MKECCGAERSQERLEKGLALLSDIQSHEATRLFAANPHELLRAIETLSVLSNAELVLQASLARRASSKQLNFIRTDYPEMDPPEWHKFVTVNKASDGVEFGEKAIDYYGKLDSSYEVHNQEYLK
jgi:succinate dehydrogenase/fumarate reductase flavoprotein subunit